MQAMETLNATIVAAFVGCWLTLWHAWGVWRLQRRGEDGLQAAGWSALIVPPLIVLFCIMTA